ncbi:HBS1-like protein [Allomyces javanicus]|nr:HBS1-like protein [Allomyces javanicus]
MSRHRAVRNLTRDDFDDDFDDDYDPRLVQAMPELREIVGDDFDDAELEETLLYYDYSVVKAVRWLLDGVDPDAEPAPKPKAAALASSSAQKKPAAAAAASTAPATASPLVSSNLARLLAPKSATSTAAATGPAPRPNLTVPSTLLAAKPKPGPTPAPAKSTSAAGSPLLSAGLANLLRKPAAASLTAPAAGRAPLGGLVAPKALHDRLGGMRTVSPAPARPSSSSTTVGAGPPVRAGTPGKLVPRASMVPRAPAAPAKPVTPVAARVDPVPVARPAAPAAAAVKRATATPSPFARGLVSAVGMGDCLAPILDWVAQYPACLYPASSKYAPFAFNVPSPDDIVLAAQAQSKNLNKGNASGTSSPAKSAATTPKKGSGNNGKKGVAASLSGPTTIQAPLNVMQELTAGVKDMRVAAAANSAAASGATTPEPAAPAVSKKRIDIAAEYAQRAAHLNLVMVGHVDAGKSTLTGHLLYQAGVVEERQMRAYHRDAAKAGKGSFSYAWVMDQNEQERARGVTIDVGVTHLTTPSGRKVTFLDAPGHRDFVPNMIGGAAQADVAVLVVDATPGQVEMGLSEGQTREHLLLVKSLGIPRIVVAVNKMDHPMVNWSRAHFERVRMLLASFMAGIGYNVETHVVFVPTSALAGENLTQRLPHGHVARAWYADQPCLLDVLDMLPVPTRPILKPLRMLVTDSTKGGMSSGSVTVWGRIEQGSMQIGDSVMLMPLGQDATVRHIEVKDEAVKWAAAGDHVMVSLAGPDPQQLSAGLVLCARDAPVPVTNRVEAKILVFEPKVPITMGYPVILHQGTLNEPAFVTKLLAILDKTDGSVTKKNPRVLTKGATALVELSLDRPVCLEAFTDCKEFGRFMLRKGGETIAAGVVSKVVTYYQPAALRAESRSNSAWSLADAADGDL